MKHYFLKLCSLVCMLFFTSSAMADVSPDMFEQSYQSNDVKISPDGKHLAIALVNEGRRTLAVVDRSTMKAVGGVNFGRVQDVGNFFWATDERLVMEILHRTDWDDKVKYYGELYATDYDGKHGELIYGFRAGEKQVGSNRKKNESIYGWARVVSTLPDDPKHILISSTELPGGSELMLNKQKRDQVDINEMRTLHSTVHRLNIHNGKMGPALTRSPVPNTIYFTSAEGSLQYAIGGQSASDKEAFRMVGDEWHSIELKTAGLAQPLGFDSTMENVIYLGDTDEHKGCLLSQSLSSGDFEKLSQECDLSREAIVISSTNTSPIAYRSSKDETYQALRQTHSEAEFFAGIADLFKGTQVSITSGSEDGAYYVVKAVSQEGNAFYLYDGTANQFARLL